MKRKFLSLILMFAMTVSLLTVGTGAVEPIYGDTAGHWAKDSIDRWSGHGIIQGSNGEFDPNGQLTCAQLATILTRLLKLPAGPDAGFSDVAADAWYADAVDRCAAAGILNGNGDGTVSPTAPITRERAMVMLGRALGIQPVENPDLSKHSDAAKVSDYAQGIVAAMIEAGIVTGVGGDQIAPQDDINRASTVTILDRAISAYADQAGETVKGDGKGIILVVAENVTITGDVDTLLVVAPEATVTLDGANAKNISVNGEDSKLVLNNSEVGNVAVSGANTEVETKGSSKVEKVDVAEEAKGASISAGSGTTIGTVDSKADNVGISGDGKVENASVSGDNTRIDTKDTKVDVAEGVIGTTAGGKEVSGGTTAETTPATPSTPSGGGSSGGSSTPGHSHVWATAWTYDGTHHWRECTAADCTVSSNEGKDGYAEHTFEGDTCTECGFTKCVEVWTGYSGTKVASYATVAEAAAALGANKWIVVARDHTLTEDFEIKDGVYLDVAKDASLTVAEGVTLMVAADAKRLGVRAGAALVNNGTILVCGSSTANGFAMLYGTMSGNGLTVPAGCFLDNNGKNFFATADEDAVYEITYGDGTVTKTADISNIRGGSITQIRLLSDVTGGWSLDNTVYSVGPEAVLDLNGHTISYSGANPNYSTLNVYTRVTVKNGTVRYEGSKRGAMEVLGQGELTIGSDVTVDGGSGFGIFTSGTSRLTVNGTVKADGNYAIAGNGSRDKGGYIDSCDTTVNEGAWLEAPNGIAIYHPEKGTVTINGGTISGHTGVELCAGRLSVSGGSITSTGDNWDATGSQNAIKDGAAVSIIDRDYPGGTPTAEITGGVFTASGSGAQTVKAYDYRSSAVAEWTTVGESVNISGGSFSSIPSNMSALCADGYEAKEAGGKWTVQVKSQPGGETGTQVGAVKGFTLSVPEIEGAPYFDLTIQEPDNAEGIEWYILYGQDATGAWKQLSRVYCGDSGTIEFYKLVGLKADCTKMKIVSEAEYGTNYRDNEAIFECNITVANNSEPVTTTAAFTKDENGRYSIALTGEPAKSSTAVFSNTGDAGDVLSVLTGMRDGTNCPVSEDITDTTYYCIYEYSGAAVDGDGNAAVTVAKTAWQQIAPTDSKASLLPSQIRLNYSNAGGLTLQMTPSTVEDKIDGTYRLHYEITCGEQTSTADRALNPAEVSTVLIPDYSKLSAGTNTVRVTFTATPTAAAAADDYTEESTTFTATVRYTEEEEVVHEGIAAQLTAPAEGQKTLTVTGLEPNRGYRVAAQVGESGTVNYRDGVTDGEGTFTSTWYTDDAFDRCTIREWTVSDVTETTASIVCTPYSGTVLFT